MKKILVIVGPTSVGKTSLILRYLNNFPPETVEPTIEETYFTKIEVKNENKNPKKKKIFCLIVAGIMV